MRKYHLRHALHVVLFLLGMLGCACACQSHTAEVPDPANAVYFWRQELALSPTEQAWLSRNGVHKLYLHLFDVARDSKGDLQPRATLTVTDLPPAGTEVIPVVFLNHDLMRDTTGLSTLPQLIARRVNAMMKQNNLEPLHELQIDFDWTHRNQIRYFELLSQLRESLDELSPRHVRLSATIRLHQLQLEAPPVDYGALMVYNIGRIKDADETCSILTEEHLLPYLQHLPHYKLPLCTALPVFSWDLLFHDQEFRRILRGVDLHDTTTFRPLDATHYQAIRYMPIPPDGVSMRADGRIFPGDVVRHESVSPQLLHRVRQLLCQKRPSACRQIILYHLDENQLKQYTDEDILSIYAGS